MTDEPKPDDAKPERVEDAKAAANVGNANVDHAKMDVPKVAANADHAERPDDAKAAKVDKAKVDDARVDDVEVGPPKKRTLKERLKEHLEEYGKVALITYITLSLLTIAGFSIAIAIGVHPSSATGILGVIGAGWAAAKATMPIRILIVLAITPPIAALVTRRKRNRSSESSGD